MTNKPNVTSKFEEERLRAAEQSQIVYLQGQIDEMRRLIKDQSNKYSWAMEQDRDQVAGWLVRIEELEQRTLIWQAQIREGEERHRSLASQLEGFYTADESVRAEVRKVSEEIQIEKQSLRRQAIEAQQLVADVRSILDDHHSRLIRLDEVRQHITLFTEQLPAQIAGIETKLPEINSEIKRVERVSTERFLMNQERLEEVRHLQEDKVIALQETDDLHQRQMASWLERLDGWVRVIEQRLARAVNRIDQTQHEQADHLTDIERRYYQFMDARATTLRGQLEQFKADEIERGADTRR